MGGTAEGLQAAGGGAGQMGNEAVRSLLGGARRVAGPRSSRAVTEGQVRGTDVKVQLTAGNWVRGWVVFIFFLVSLYFLTFSGRNMCCFHKERKEQVAS